MLSCARDPVDLFLQLRPGVPGQPRAAPRPRGRGPHRSRYGRASQDRLMKRCAPGSFDGFVQHAGYVQNSGSDSQDILVQHCALDAVDSIVQRYG
eukprot:11737898-Alexandrium_andersonii.AAC.1